MDEIPLPLTLNRRIIDLENRISAMEKVRVSKIPVTVPTVVSANVSAPSSTWKLVASSSSYMQSPSLGYAFCVEVASGDTADWVIRTSVYPYSTVVDALTGSAQVGSTTFSGSFVLPDGGKSNYVVSLYLRLASGVGPVVAYVNSPFSSGVA